MHEVWYSILAKQLIRCVSELMHIVNLLSKKSSLVVNHFNNTCSLDHLSVQPIEIIGGDGRSEKSAKQRKLRETFWIKELRTVYPYGLNDRCNGQEVE